MENDLYISCLNEMNSLCLAVTESGSFFALMDKTEKKWRFPLFFAFDVFKGVPLFAEGIKRLDPVQCSLLSRQLLEQASLSITLFTRPELIEKFKIFWDERVLVADMGQNQKRKALKLFAEKENINENKLLDYLDYGWLRGAGGNNDYGVEKMMKFAGFEEDFKKWRLFYNKLTHLSITTINVISKPAEAVALSNNLTYNVVAWLDDLCCAMHNATGYSFVIDGVDFFGQFREAFKKATDSRLNGKAAF